MTAALDGVSPLPHLGVIRAQGEDAASFLHGQLTQDFALLRPGQARLAAFCSAKGRMQASFIAVSWAPGDFALVVSADLLAQTMRRLSMFVLRSKVKLTDASGQFILRGVAGPALVQLAGGTAPSPWSQTDVAGRDATVEDPKGGRLVGLYPAQGQPRALWLAAAGTPEPVGPSMDPALWQWGEVQSGVAMVSLPLFEALVPQMLNYESVGGVNFKKGCYPGQEVVARSQFRGTLKRRATLAHCEGPLAPGMEIFHDADPEQPAGLVAQAAPAPGGGWDAIVSLQISAMEGGQLTAGSPQGAALSLGALPYELLADI